jgi:hypothetical protein
MTMWTFVWERPSRIKTDKKGVQRVERASVVSLCHCFAVEKARGTVRGSDESEAQLDRVVNSVLILGLTFGSLVFGTV